ncbi:sensory neuron membrane protein 2 [Halictus rubicundus]|uniref:sensory neuron membrane protein 2 n=1 Tax=Halictus rubicundus TaxID=77578 RepID=UPI004035FD32
MIFTSVFGGILIVFGLTLSIEQYITSFIKVKIQQYLPLAEGTPGYVAYTTLAPLTLSCYLFNVTNPDEVMRGEYPNLVEHGPYVYEENMQRYVQDVNEEMDEITYITRTMYTFNRRKSVNVSNREKVTILNPAYVGTLMTLSSLPSNFMEKYGNHIPKLFLNSSSIFLKARATDILFNGVKLTCNAKKFPELSLICQTMQNRRPPVIRETDKEGVYLLSMFQKVNDTPRGPYTVNRGVKDLTLLGDTTSFMGKRVLTLWNSESCNIVRGTDTLNWPPLIKPLPFVTTFLPDYCRSLEIDYDRDVIIHGIKGSKYSMQERVWFLNSTQCYCPVKDNKVECLQQGLLDGSECQVLNFIIYFYYILINL